MATPSKSSSALQKPAFDSLQQEAFLNLWRTYDRLKAFEDETFSKHGLSPQQYNALRLLRSVAPEPMATLDLGRRLITRAPDMTRLLDRLERRGLLSRHRPADNRRMVAVSITPDGLKLLDQMQQSVLECHSHQLGHLDVKSLRQLTQLLKAARKPHEDATNPTFIDD